MSLIENAYIIGDNKVGSTVSVVAFSNSSEEVTAHYQWYRSSIYDGKYSKIIGIEGNQYRISPSDKYIKCLVVGYDNFENTVETNILVVDQSGYSASKDDYTNSKLSMIGNGLYYDKLVSDVSGQGNIVSDIKRINQSIMLILSMALGEVPMLPDLGTNIHKMIFNGATPENNELIRVEVENRLREQEPRIDLLSVEANYDDEHSVNIIVNYQVKNTNIKSRYIHNIDSGGDVVV